MDKNERFCNYFALEGRKKSEDLNLLGVQADQDVYDCLTYNYKMIRFSYIIISAYSTSDLKILDF